jgi:hypothetical protein
MERSSAKSSKLPAGSTPKATPLAATAAMPPHLSNLTKCAETLATSDGHCIDVWELRVPATAGYLSAWASNFRQHYCSESEIDDLRAGTGLSRAEYLTQLVFPDKTAAPGPGIRAGDFAELLISDYVEYLLGPPPIQLAHQWLQGNPYRVLFEHSSAEKGTKPWGAKQRRRLTEDDIVDFCESTLGFECSLVLAAVAQFLFGENGIHEEGAAALILFQKALKYGLPDWPSISCYEHGFADRVVAQRLCDAARAEGFSGKLFAPALKSHRERIEAALKDYPTYFESVLAGRV